MSAKRSPSTPPATAIKPNAVRLPNNEELKQIRKWLRDNSYGEVMADWLLSAWIAVFDHYQTDCPGYAGKVILAIWGGFPDAVTVFIEEKGKLVMSSNHNDVCGKED